MRPINPKAASAGHNSPRTCFVPNQNSTSGFDIEDSAELNCGGLVDNDRVQHQSAEIACLSSIVRQIPKLS